MIDLLALRQEVEDRVQIPISIEIAGAPGNQQYGVVVKGIPFNSKKVLYVSGTIHRLAMEMEMRSLVLALGQKVLDLLRICEQESGDDSLPDFSVN